MHVTKIAYILALAGPISARPLTADPGELVPAGEAVQQVGGKVGNEGINTVQHANDEAIGTTRKMADMVADTATQPAGTEIRAGLRKKQLDGVVDSVLGALGSVGLPVAKRDPQLSGVGGGLVDGILGKRNPQLGGSGGGLLDGILGKRSPQLSGVGGGLLDGILGKRNPQTLPEPEVPGMDVTVAVPAVVGDLANTEGMRLPLNKRTPQLDAITDALPVGDLLGGGQDSDKDEGDKDEGDKDEGDKDEDDEEEDDEEEEEKKPWEKDWSKESPWGKRDPQVGGFTVLIDGILDNE